jgi:hypothetical protein
VELFNFIRWVLVIIVTTTLFWPLTVPLAALAYKVRLGPEPVPMDTTAYWTRSAFAALGMAVMALVLAGVDYLLISGGMPPGVVHFALLLLYVPVAIWFLTTMFALEDLLQGLSVLIIWVFLPGLVLGGLNLIGFGLPLALAESWLPPVASP